MRKAKIVIGSLLPCLIIMFSSPAKAQSTNLKNEEIKVNYVALPSHPVLDESMRTYSIAIQCSQLVEQAYASDLIKDRIVLHGFEKVNERGFLTIEIKINDIIIDNVEYEKSEEVEKDEDGNVISRKYYFTPIISYESSVSYQIIDPREKPLAYYMNDDYEYETSSRYESKKKAEAFVSNNLNELKNSFYEELIDTLIRSISYKINGLYGYVPIKTTANLAVLSSKKHPEYEDHQSNYRQIATYFKEMKYNLPTDGIFNKVKPVIAYYESLIPKYADPKKSREKKMRYASYYNIAQLYYYLDMPDKTIEYANKLIENGTNKSKGKRLIDKANVLKKRFKTNGLSSRHFEVITTDITSEKG